MKFKLVETFLNESSSYIYISGADECLRVLKSYYVVKDNTRGNGVLCETLISMWNTKFGTSYNSDDFLVHHINGLHDINYYTNLCLIPKTNACGLQQLEMELDELKDTDVGISSVFKNKRSKAVPTNNTHHNIHSTLLYRLMCAYANQKGLTPGSNITSNLFRGMTTLDEYLLLKLYMEIADKRTRRASVTNTILFVEKLI